MAVVIAGIQFRATSNVARTLARTRRAFRTFAQNANAHLRSMNRQMNKFIGKVDKLVGKLRGGRLGTMIGIGALAYGATDAVKTLAEVESIETAIKFASGSTEKGIKNIEFLRKLAKDLKVDYLAAADGFKLFSSAFIGTDTTMQEQQEMFLDMSKAIRVFGLGTDKTRAVFYALSEMVGKGTIQAQELKQQLGNALPGAMSNFAESAGKTRAQIMKLMESGKLVTMKFIKPFTEHMGKKVESGIPKAIETTMAKLTDLSNTVMFAKMDIGEALVDAGAVDLISKYVNKIKDWIAANKTLITQRLERLFRLLGKALEFIAKNIRPIISLAGKLVSAYFALKAAQLALNVAMYLFPGSWIAVAIALIVLALAYVIIKTEGWSNAWTQLVINIKEGWGLIKRSFSMFGDTLGILWDGMLLNMEKGWYSFLDFFGADMSKELRKVNSELDKLNLKADKKVKEWAKLKEDWGQWYDKPSAFNNLSWQEDFMTALSSKSGIDFSALTGGADPNAKPKDTKELKEVAKEVANSLYMNITAPEGTNVDVSSPGTSVYIVDGMLKK